ncbi:MAG: FecR domain-containing protein [Aquamicrobium sp.]|uniref:FecR family protein n=1 Tax=Aquamicrobium sp. TaxID=1872579 RepID=UPI00349EABFB|nr:FecR domain-containing protein [Aquamicrobium sp.]MCO5155559.1 FecR domain-containing protein [Aquamicrobium sp.]
MDETDKRHDGDDHGEPHGKHRVALDARDWIVRLTSGNVSAAELERFKAWRDQSQQHRRAFERERAFWRQLQALDGKSDGMPPFRPLPGARRAPVGRRAFLIGGGAVAASAAAAIVAMPRLGVWWNADFTTAVGEQARIDLPDGSVATLNTDSAIAVDFTPQLRLVTLLKGEAEFGVRPDASSLFRVAALGGNSDALGTTFAVKALEDVATVTVREGHVRVAGPASPTDIGGLAAGGIDLAANEQTTYGAGEPPLPASAVDIEAVMAWRDGRVIFEGRPFAAAMAELGRYVPERIVLAPGVRPDVPVSAIFSTANALDAVQALAKTQGLVARRVPGVMILVA